jgi:hypothetical protein
MDVMDRGAGNMPERACGASTSAFKAVESLDMMSAPVLTLLLPYHII